MWSLSIAYRRIRTVRTAYTVYIGIKVCQVSLKDHFHVHNKTHSCKCPSHRSLICFHFIRPGRWVSKYCIEILRLTRPFATIAQYWRAHSCDTLRTYYIKQLQCHSVFPNYSEFGTGLCICGDRGTQIDMWRKFICSADGEQWFVTAANESSIQITWPRVC